MKFTIALLVCFIGYNVYTQSWLDGKCKTLDQSITSSEFDEANERNVFSLVINQADDIVINGEAKPKLREIAFKELVLDFVTNPKQHKNKASNPDKVYIQLSSFKKKSNQIEEFKTYIQEVYIYLWDKYASQKYDSSYIELNCKKRSKVFDRFPLRIIGEINRQEKSDNRPRGVGVPPFAGDVKDN
ncbi:hypothetical protein [Mesohalobacter halotolerans]|uniref:Uncharacterized protein n=1 Tax=Mesohalobacter halotolerans TaxID=1883405 RepID=A0A4U5TPB2_9FLAO|nr:hypothetical protein [Mesohalobacter halotolerans]MBS3738035.1 hypothetical protein [Psychroflexus sp.]TKS55793.1 hypothetical protein FCN74_10880 [Mesohalobacter halotolerans]